MSSQAGGGDSRSQRNVIRLAMDRPVTTIMVFISLLVLGTVAGRLLPLEYFPDLDIPFVAVMVPYQGSTPGQVEQEIIRPLEESLALISGIKEMHSTARADSAEIFMIFDWGISVAGKALEARERVSAVQHTLPSDVRRVNVFKFSTSDQPVLQLRLSSHRDLSESYDMLHRKLVRPLSRIPGVGKVELHGVEPNELRIELDPQRVIAHGVDLGALQIRLAEANFSASAGLLSDGPMRYRVLPQGEMYTVEEYRDLVIREDGLRLDDVAEISVGSGRRTYGRHLDQRYAIGLHIFKERGANLVDVGRRALLEIEQIREQKEMQGIELFFLDNQAEGVVESLTDLLTAGLIGALLSMVVLYLFLRNITTTLMVALAVPVSITVTLGGMFFLDVSLNILSMMGLMLAVGMLVDNAVVVSESIFKERQRLPQDPKRAAEQGTRLVGMAVFAGTLTSAIVFLPNIFGEQNQVSLFLAHVAYAITIALATSLLVSVTVIPMIASRLKRPPGTQQRSWIAAVTAKYQKLLAWTLRRRGISVSVILATVGLTAALPMQMVETDMFPREVTRELFLRFNLDGRYPLERVERAVDTIETYLYANQEEFEIRAVYSYFNEEGEAQSSILLTDEDDARRNAKEIEEAIREGLPKIAIGEPSFENSRDNDGNRVSVTMVGDSSEMLVKLAAEAARQLALIDGLVDVRSAAGAGEREVGIRVDRERAARHDLSSEQVAMAVSAGIRGAPLSEVRTRTGEMPVSLAFGDESRQTVDQLRTFQVMNEAGDQVALSAVADLSLHSGPVSVRRTDRETALRITANRDDIEMEEAKKRIRSVMDGFELPAGYRWSFGSGFDRAEETQEKMVFNILIAIAMIYLVMAALFESLLFPLSIITAIFFSILGVYWGFWISGTTFSLMALIGILILIGVVVNNGIVLLDHINHLRSSGMERGRAIVEGGGDRLRPILMTVATTVLGLIPLAVGTTQIGGDGPPYFPMARAIIFGLLFSTITNLLFLPTLYSLLDDLRKWASDLGGAARQRLDSVGHSQ